MNCLIFNGSLTVLPSSCVIIKTLAFEKGSKRTKQRFNESSRREKLTFFLLSLFPSHPPVFFDEDRNGDFLNQLGYKKEVFFSVRPQIE
jgi:hypothetical protein